MDILKKIYFSLLSYELKGAKEILDVGCGRSHRLKNVKGSFHSTGIDGHKPYIDECREKGYYDTCILGDVMKAEFPPKSYDVVMSYDLIEHLPKEESEKMLSKMENWGKKVIIATPNGFEPNYHQLTTEGLTPEFLELQTHKCGWDTDELKARGYRVYGMEGFKFLLGTPFYKLSFPFTYLFPQYANKLWAIK